MSSFQMYNKPAAGTAGVSSRPTNISSSNKGPGGFFGTGMPEYKASNITGVSSYFKPETIDYLSKLQQQVTGMESPNSPWMQMMRQQIGEQYQTGREAATGQLSGQLAAAREQLAARRGLSTGAGERLAMQGGRNQMMALQQLGRQQSSNINTALMGEYEKKLALQQMLPQLQMQRAQYETDLQKGNIERMLDERQKAYGSKLDIWKTVQQLEAAKAQAAAIRESAGGGLFGGGGILGTGIGKNW